MATLAISNLSPLMSSRFEAIEQQADNFYEQMTGKKEKINIEIDLDLNTVATHTPSKTIFIDPLFLIHPKDFSPNLPISEFKTDRVQFIKKLKTWLIAELGVAESQLAKFKPRLEHYTKIWTCPIDPDRIKKFALAHEIAHIFHGHTLAKWDKRATTVCSLIISALFFTFFNVFLAAGLSLLTHFVLKRIFLVVRTYLQRGDEKEADLTAVKITKDVEAAIENMKCAKALDEEIWARCTWKQRLLFLAQFPETYFNATHPSSDERINYLKLTQLA